MGNCFRSSETPDRQPDSSQPLLHEEDDDQEDVTRVVNRSDVPHTVINLPSPGSRPPPITYDDIPSPTNPPPILSPFGSNGNSALNMTPEGQDLLKSFKEAYKWKDAQQQPSLEFSHQTNLLFAECETHFSKLSSEGTKAAKEECDILVNELLALREHWGPSLLPLSMRNAFIRERITITLGDRGHQFKIDCIQFFEPIVFYGNAPGKKEDLVKLYVFVVNDAETDNVIIRYYLERSFLFEYYHVLCYFKGDNRGQLKPYGTKCPSYWTIREHMYQDSMFRLKSLVQDKTMSSSSDYHPIATTYFPASRQPLRTL